MEPLAEAYFYQDWQLFGERFAEQWAEANHETQLSMLRDLLCCYRDTRAQAAVLAKCDLK